MILIVAGICGYLVMQYIEKRRKGKKTSKVSITDLTDFELRPMEEQDINYNEAVNMFSSARSMLSKQQITYLDVPENTLGNGIFAVNREKYPSNHPKDRQASEPILSGSAISNEKNFFHGTY